MLKIILITISLFYTTTNLNAQVKDHDLICQKDSISPYKPAARYNGDIKELSKTLGKKYALKKTPLFVDSSVTFKAFVDQKPLNDLQRIELVKGSRSAFSDFIKQGLLDSGKAWRSMLQGGRAVKSFIRLHAQLNSDGSITIMTCNDI